LGLPLGRFWCKLVWYIFLAFLASSIRCRCPIHLRRWSLMKIPILMSVYSSSSLEFVRIRHWLCSITAPNVFFNFPLRRPLVFFHLTYLQPMFVLHRLPLTV
jgi:hypothetical protein